MANLHPDEALRWRLLRRVPAEDYGVFRTERHVCCHPTIADERTFSVLRMPDWVNIIALTRDDRVVMVRQYRHGTDEVTLEIPGGAVDADETHGDAAARELLEETGFSATEWHRIGEIQPNPAIQDNVASTWLAIDAVRSDAPKPDAGEIIDIDEVPLASIRELLRGGVIRHGIVVAAFAHLLLRTGGDFVRPRG